MVPPIFVTYVTSYPFTRETAPLLGVPFSLLLRSVIRGVSTMRLSPIRTLFERPNPLLLFLMAFMHSL